MMFRRAARILPSSVRRVLRPAARRVGLAAAEGAWDELGGRIEKPPLIPENGAPSACNICRWTGDSFAGPLHCEMADCPRCGSIARDRFLMLCFLSRTAYRRDMRVLETSPRLGEPYRRAMRRSFDYTASDFDLSAHEGDIRIDLQNIELPDASVDILLTPHVLEHVPDTSRALREIFRVLSPGGRMYLQVPLTRGATAVPSQPEFHADNTPVFYNFGWDLTSTIRSSGFETHVLVTADFSRILSDRSNEPPQSSDGFDLSSLWADVALDDLAIVADGDAGNRLGFQPAHQFATWECIKPK